MYKMDFVFIDPMIYPYIFKYSLKYILISLHFNSLFFLLAMSIAQAQIGQYVYFDP